MKTDNKKIVDSIKTLEINKSLKIPYRGLIFKITNEYSELKSKIRLNSILRITLFIVLSLIYFIVIAIILTTLGSLIDKSGIGEGKNYSFLGENTVLILAEKLWFVWLIISFMLANFTLKKIIRILFKKRINEFYKLIEGIELKSIENSLNSKNPFFIEKLFELKKGKLSKSLIELKKQNFAEDLEVDFITKQEYQYLLKIIENEQ